MDSTTFNIVLFLHITVAIAAFMVAGVLHVGLAQMRRARTVAELKAWEPTITRLEPLFPVMAVLLVGLGAWLLHLSGGEFRWSDGWVITAVVALAIVEAVGAGVMGRSSKALMQQLHAAPDGAVHDELRRAILTPKLWLGAHGTTGAVIGIVCLMATKPSGPISVVVVAVAAALGVVSAIPLLKPPVVDSAAASSLVVPQRTPTERASSRQRENI